MKILALRARTLIQISSDHVLGPFIVYLCAGHCLALPFPRMAFTLANHCGQKWTGEPGRGIEPVNREAGMNRERVEPRRGANRRAPLA